MKAIVFIPIILLCLSFWSIPLASQTCVEANEWVVKAKGLLDLGECDFIRNKLEGVLASCLQEKDSLDASLGDIYHKLGLIYYECGPEEMALHFLDLAIKVRSIQFGLYHEQTANSFYLRALTNSFLEKNEAAGADLEKTIKIIQDIEVEAKDSLLSLYYIQLAHIYSDIGDYNRTQLSIQYADAILDYNNVRAQYRYYFIKGKNDEQLGKYDAAKKNYLEARHILSKNKLNQQEIRYGLLSENMGVISLKLKDYQQASSLFEEAIMHYQRAKKPDTFNIVMSVCDLIESSTKLDQFDKANLYFEKGLFMATAYFSSTHYPIFSRLYYQKAAIDKAQKKHLTALQNLQNAITAVVPSFLPKSLTKNPILSIQPTGDKIKLREALYLKAQILQQKYQEENQQTDLEAAFDTYTSLDTLLTQTRQSFKAIGSKYFLQEAIVPIYEEAISVAFQLYILTQKSFYKEAAHRFLSRNKAIILIEGLQDEKIKFASLPEELLAKEARLKKINYELEAAIYGAEQEENKETLEQLQDSLFTTKRVYEKLIQSFEEQYPNYYHHKYDYYNTFSIPAIQSQLGADRAVIEFFIGEQYLFVSTISKNDFQIYQSTLAEHFDTLCYDFIGMSRGDNLEEKRFASTAYQLYKDLLQKPLSALDPSITRLTIIPDDLLLQLSFDVLLTKSYDITPNTWNDENIPYLLRKYALSRVYASSLLFNEQDQKQLEQAPKSYLGIGIEDYDFTKQHPSPILDSVFQQRISGRLLHSDDEVRDIQKIIGGDTLINRAAIKGYFMKHGQEYDILHFATHGMANEASPLNSALVFAKLPDETDYLLKAADVYSMNLNASLTVLSACQTSYGFLQKGEGMRTLARAFAYAGSPSLVASLSNISDASSREIFTRFYQNLKNGQSKDVALQQAKLDYISSVDDVNKALPTRWAQTILIGDSKALSIRQPINFVCWLLLGVGGIAFFLMLFLFRTK